MSALSTTDPFKPLLITMGDAAGIGPEIIVKAFASSPDDLAGTVVAGDMAVMRRALAMHGAQFGAASAFALAEVYDPADAEHLPPRCLPVWQACDPVLPPAFGAVSAAAGLAAAQCIVKAAQLALEGRARGLVTAPIHKEALAAAGEPWAAFPGHTEMLQAQAAAFLGCPASALPVRMMLANSEIRTVLVSIHMSLRQAIEAVRFDTVLETLEITHSALIRLLGHPPRLGVAGLNPHAGENGLFGREEIEQIVPAIAAARAEGIDASGPYAPDTVFMRARQQQGRSGEFDAVVAMYHDQGLIPVKYLGVADGVNVTLGLPLLRTSPDHGTAFDIAGTGSADPSSLLCALRMARSLASQA
jgi:4-hydroxythreonine-4-phosphate dehydrogenase